MKFCIVGLFSSEYKRNECFSMILLEFALDFDVKFFQLSILIESFQSIAN